MFDFVLRERELENNGEADGIGIGSGNNQIGVEGESSKE